MEAGIQYLLEHGRGAALPDVRLRIQESSHFPDMAEVRVDGHIGGEWCAYRVLACFVEEDQSLLIWLGGDKHKYEKEAGTLWYGDYVPVADQIVDRFIKEGGGARWTT
jgi:hypothetical protein